MPKIRDVVLHLQDLIFSKQVPQYQKKNVFFLPHTKKNQLKFAVWLTVDQSTFDQFRRDLAALQFMNSKS